MAARVGGEIIVAAGVNGAGKSTIIGARAKISGVPYFNPDEQTRAYLKAGLLESEANARSWRNGYESLKKAIDTNTSFTFETTLGGTSIVAELLRALALNRRVTIYYVGLESVELHLQRVAARVARGGHDIPEGKIRERFVNSRENLLKFIGTQAEIRVWDNSAEDPAGIPMPADVLTIRANVLLYPDSVESLHATKGWAKALVQAALTRCSRPPALENVAVS